MNATRNRSITRGLTLAFICLQLANLAAQDAKTEELTLVVKEQKPFTPGYAIGNIAIGDPEVADYKVMPGRKEIMLFAKGKGETRLLIWDQKNVKRHDVKITVGVKEEMQAETDLKELLAPFPTVSVRKLGEQLVVTGQVSTDADMDAVGRIATAASAQNLVRLVKTSAVGAVVGPPASTGSTSPSAPGDPPSPTATTATGTTAPAAAAQVEYEVELLEAHVAFQSGTYGVGIEPSGRTLFKKVVRAPFNGDTEVIIPGTAALSPKADNKLKQQASLRLRVRPTALSEEGELTSFVSIETNVPVEGSKDPSITRRARWELVSKHDEPFGLGGAELMAMPQVVQGRSKLGRILETAGSAAGTAGSVPGVSGYTGYVPSYLPYYDKDKKTQLLAVFRPRVVQGAAK
jgi:Pilus formation protein N terminal region